MNRRTFFQSVLFAFLISFFSALVAFALDPIFGRLMVLKALLAVSSLAYLGFLVGQKAAGAGRPTAFVLWLAGAAGAWSMTLGLGGYLAAHAGLIWLLRSPFSYRGVVPWLLDLTVSALAVPAALWALVQTGSVGWMLWTFFLVQALSCAIPPSVGRGENRAVPRNEGADFDRAYRHAELAVQRLLAD